MPKNLKGFDDFAKSFRKAAPYLNSVYAFMASIGIFGYMGYWADAKFETRPLLLLIGLFIGLGIGFYQFYRVLMKQEERE
jgi:F0F1-type ATP synthase assembly protein I